MAAQRQYSGLDMAGQALTGLPDPANADDAATKGYVDGRLHVGPTNELTGPGLWVQTLPNGDWTLWIEDGA